MKKIQYLVIFSMIILTGCVTGTRTIELSSPNLSVDKSVSGKIYISSIEDKRSFEQKPRRPSTPSVKGDLSSTPQEKLSTLIGRQRNGYGMAMGDITLPQNTTVQSQIRELITKGLESRGYEVVNDKNAPNKITIDIEKFWAWFSPGFAWVTFESNLQCAINFEQPLGKDNLEITGHGINRGQVASNANWVLAFERAFLNFLENMDKTLSSKGL